MNLKEILTRLHNGETVVLETRVNQHGELVDIDYLTFEDGAWMRSKLNCWNSQDFGFGTCRCQSHPAFLTERISRKDVLFQLRSLLRREAEDRAARGAEIAWLDEQLSRL